MSLYTGRGDDGKTDLWSGDRVSKTSPRIEAYGCLDELNGYLGMALSSERESSEVYKPEIDEVLSELQNSVFKMQAQLANPNTDAEKDPTITREDVEWVEQKCDEIDEMKEPVEKFVLPGGGRTGSILHVARTVARRCERRCLGIEEDVDEDLLIFLNRLSDLLFALARLSNQVEGFEEEHPKY